MIKIIQVASSHIMGLTNQEVNLAINYNTKKIDLLVLSGENEQYPSLFLKLKKNKIKYNIIYGLDEHKNFYKLIKNTYGIIKKFKPEFITVNTNWQLVIFGIANLINKNSSKIIYTVHGFRHNSNYIISLISRILIGVALILFSYKVNCPTTYVANKFSFLKRKIEVIPLGEDAIFFNSSVDYKKIGNEYNICFPGAFRHGKNQLELINVFEYFVNGNENILSNLYLPGDGPLLEECKEYVKKRGLSDRIYFPGQLNRLEILEIYEKCQIAVVPSNDETFGHCIVEPLIMGLIVVTKNIGVAQDVIVDKENGFIYKSKAELLNVLISIVKADKNKLLEISKNGKITSRCFDWGQITNRHIHELFNV